MYREESMRSISVWDRWLLIDKDRADANSIIWVSYFEFVKQNRIVSSSPEFRHRFNLSTLELILERASEPIGTVSAFSKSYFCNEVPLSTALVD